jgi:DNA-binding response OmpR family regulator
MRSRAGIGDVGKPRRVGVRRHHDPREIAVIGARLERARAPCRDGDDGRRPQRAQRRNPVRARGLGGQNHEAHIARGDDHRHPHAQVRPRARDPLGGGRKKGCARIACHGRNVLAGCCQELKHSLAPSHGCVRYSYSSLCECPHPRISDATRRPEDRDMATLKKILLVDDDDDLREALSEQLVMTEDFDVFEAGSGAQAMERVKEGLYDLVILDVGLPDTDGRELCRLLRKQGVKCPILMLTGHDSDADTILGLDAGANDYVTKPFRFPVLLARIRAQLRQHEQSEDAVFQLGPYTFKPAMKILETEDNKKVRLTEKETNILKFLYRAQSGVVARDVLLHEVWGYNAGVTTHTLETHIYRLRQKIEPDPSNARLLVTESGGYRLVA